MTSQRTNSQLSANEKGLETDVLGEQPSLPSGSYFLVKDPFKKGQSFDLDNLSSSLALSVPEFCLLLLESTTHKGIVLIHSMPSGSSDEERVTCHSEIHRNTP